jgi:CheY-like chemotaxis protein
MAGARRVLVVDDDPNVASMLSDLVQTFGYRTATASNAAQALRAVREFLPHVVLLDIRMPGITGDTILARLRTSTPSVPVIMVTGNRDEDEAKRVLAAGAWDYVSKPVDATYLEGAIAAAAATSPESADEAPQRPLTDER